MWSDSRQLIDLHRQSFSSHSSCVIQDGNVERGDKRQRGNRQSPMQDGDE